MVYINDVPAESFIRRMARLVGIETSITFFPNGRFYHLIFWTGRINNLLFQTERTLIALVPIRYKDKERSGEW